MQLGEVKINKSFVFAKYFFDHILELKESEVQKTVTALDAEGITVNKLLKVYIDNSKIPEFLYRLNELSGRKLFLLLRYGLPETLPNSKPIYWYSKENLTKQNVKIFFGTGVSFDILDPETKETILTYNIKKRNYNLVLLLLKGYAHPNFNNATLLAESLNSDSLLNLVVYGGETTNMSIIKIAEQLAPEYFEIPYFEDAVLYQELSYLGKYNPEILQESWYLDLIPEELRSLFVDQTLNKVSKSIVTESGEILKWPSFMDGRNLFGKRCILPSTTVAANEPSQYVGETLEEDIIDPSKKASYESSISSKSVGTTFTPSRSNESFVGGKSLSNSTKSSKTPSLTNRSFVSSRPKTANGSRSNYILSSVPKGNKTVKSL